MTERLAPWCLLVLASGTALWSRDAATTLQALAICLGPEIIRRIAGARLGHLLPALLAILAGLATGLSRHDMLAAMLAAAVTAALPELSLRLVAMAAGMMIVAGFPPLETPYVFLAALWVTGLAVLFAARHARLARELGGARPPRWRARIALLGAGLALGGVTAGSLRPLERWVIESAGFATGRRTSGFSLQSDLNGITRVQSSLRIALRLHAPGPRRLRGQVYSDYRRGRWLARRPGPFTFVHGADAPAPEGLDERVELELPGYLTLFAPLEAERIHGAGCRVERNRLGIHVATAGSPGSYAYRSRRGPVASDGGTPEEEFLELPPDLPRAFFALARDWAPPGAAVREKGEALSRALGARCSYSLEPGLPAPGTDPLVHFLLHARRGHCEFFASVLVLHLRHLGIPARYVTGYSVVERNAWGGYLVARDRDAHAWVEAWSPEEGWFTLDPTPPDWRGELGSGAGEAQAVWEEALRRFALWREAVSRRVATALAAATSRLARLGSSPWGAGLAGALLLLLGLPLSRRLREALRRKLLGPAPSAPGADDLEEHHGRLERIDGLLSRRGLARLRGETVLEWRGRIDRSDAPLALRRPGLELLDLYCRCRYGRSPWPEERGETLLRALRDSVVG